MNVPSDMYGPLNRYSAARGIGNPGMFGSLYNADGTLRTESDIDTDEDEPVTHGPFAPPVEPHVIVMEPSNGLRRSRRGKPSFVPDTCKGICPITLRTIKVPFFLEADQRCYEADSIRNLQPVNGVYISPMTRKVFTEADLAKLTILKNAYRDIEVQPRRSRSRDRQPREVLPRRRRSRSRSRDRQPTEVSTRRSSRLVGRGGKKHKSKKKF